MYKKMQSTVTINHTLKMDIKKKEFIQYFKDKLSNMDIDTNMYDTLLLLIQSVEDHFYKHNKKLGQVKQQAVLETIKQLLKKPLDDKQLVGMIDSIVMNQDIKRTQFYKRWYKLLKAYFFQSGTK